MNPLTDRVITGTFGELLVQIRLLQFGVQAAAPLKDSGNDLIAIRGKCLQAIQVKTTTGRVQFKDLPDFYHLLALVCLDPDIKGPSIRLDECKVYLLSREEIEAKAYSHGLDGFEMNQARIDSLFNSIQDD